MSIVPFGNPNDKDRVHEQYEFHRYHYFIPRQYLPTIPRDVMVLATFPYNEDHTERWCYSCAAFKKLEEFGLTNGYAGQKKHKARPGGHCKECKKRPPEVSRAAYLRSAYNLTLEDYDMMFFQQGGACAVCKQPETQMDPYTGKVKNLAVDHNHETGDVRQLLCQACNQLLGHIEKDRTRVNRLVNYLKKHDT